MEELHKKYALGNESGSYFILVTSIYSTKSNYKMLILNFLDATHAADLDMLLSPLFGKVRKNPLHDQVSKSVAKLWASFIKDGCV